MQRELFEKLETPCIVIDMHKTEENVIQMQRAVEVCHCRLRPHIKTHKMPLLAKMQLDHGASGITCAKVSEAEVMADSGVQDIFIAYPMVGDFRIKRAVSLAKRIDRLILAVDSMACAEKLDQAAKNAGLILEVRMEVDTGARRTGVAREDALCLAKQLASLPNLKFNGIYTFKSLIYKDSPTIDKHLAGVEEAELMEALAAEIKNAGIPIEDISAGSTPTGLEVAKTGKVNEVRPGTYIFKDYMLYKEGVVKIEDISVRIYATVVSTPCKEYAVIDGGTKTFPMDIMLDVEPYYYPSYAIIEGNEDLVLRRMNEEHGIVTSKKGDTKLRVGDKISLIPIHVCTAINMQNQVYLYDGKHLKQEKIAARGMLV